VDTWRATAAFDRRTLHDNWGWYLVLGIGLLLFGLFALGNVALATVVSVRVFGVLLLLGGIALIALAFRGGGWGHVLALVLLGLLFLYAGWSLLRSPVIGALSLTLTLAIFFVIVGLIRGVAAVVERPRGWGWSLVSGVLTVLLGALLWAQWPVSGLYAIGLLIGIELIFDGAAWIATALLARTTPAAPAAQPA
jgi:uncharacterized membrane protein HdeD (DUF308 family)